MFVMFVARNDMPMQMRGHVAEAGEIDLVRMHHLSYRRFDGKYGCHEMPSFGSGQIGHLFDMLLPDHKAEAGVVGIRNQHHTTSFILPEQCAANLIAQLTNRFTFHDLSFIQQGRFMITSDLAIVFRVPGQKFLG